MKRTQLLTFMLAVLFLQHVFPAGAISLPEIAAGDSFRIDEQAVLQGMKQSWGQGYEPVITGHTMTLVLPIRSERAEGMIQTEIIPLCVGVSPFLKQDMSARTGKSVSGIWEVTLSLRLMQGRRNGDYPCFIRVTGNDEAGGSLAADFPWILRVRDGLPCRETVRMEVSDVKADLRLGEDGTVTAVIANPCQSVAYDQVTLSVSDPSGEIIPQYASVLPLPDLLPGQQTEVCFPVTVLNKAAVAPHTLQLQLNWTALDTARSQTGAYTLPVHQEIRLEQGGLKMASSVVAGDTVMISLPLMNMGRADIVNVLATVTLPGITERQSVLVGTIAPGETRQAQITLTPDRAVSGDFTGTLTVEAGDPDGNQVSQTLPVHLTVEEPPQPAAANNDARIQAEKPPLLIWGLAGGSGLLLLLLLVQGVLLRRKIHRLEEDRL